MTGMVYSLVEADYEKILEFADGLDLGGGRKFEVLQFHKDYLKSALNPEVTTAALSAPRKSGKSQMCSLIILYCLLNKVDFQIGCVSLTRVQTQVLQSQIFAMTRGLKIPNRKDGGILHVRGSLPQCVNYATNTICHFYSAHSSTGHGSSHQLIVLDEVGLVPLGRGTAVVQQMMDSVAAADSPKILAISVRGSSTAFSDIYQASLIDKSVTWLEYSAPLDADPGDEQVWKACNPALGKYKSMKYMRTAYKKATVSAEKMHAWKVFMLNQRLDAHAHTLVAMHEWLEACVDDPPPMDDSVTVGFDLADSNSTTAFCMYAPWTGRLDWIVAASEVPTLLERGKRSGLGTLLRECYEKGELQLMGHKSLDLPQFVDACAEMVGDRQVLAAGSDLWRVNRLHDLLDARGLKWPVVGKRPGYRDGTLMLDDLERELREGKLKPQRSLMLELNLSQCTVKNDASGNVLITKTKGSSSVNDLAHAMLIAVSLGRNHRESAEEYELPPPVSQFV